MALSAAPSVPVVQTKSLFARKQLKRIVSLQLFPHLKAKKQVSILNVHKLSTYCELHAMYQQASPLRYHKGKTRQEYSSFKGLELSQQSAFCHTKALLYGVVYIYSLLHGGMIELFFPHMILDGTPSKP